MLYSQWNRLELDKDDELLYRIANDQKQFVLPKSLRKIIYTELHDNMGHLGPERVVALARERVYWPNMQEDITTYIKTQCKCMIDKKPHLNTTAPLHELSSSGPMDLVGIDLMHLEESSGGYEYILTIVDHFTRFVQTYPLKKKEARPIAKLLYGDFINRFGIPRRLLHDQGREFENELFHNLQNLMGMKRVRTTPYHPQGNGQTERMNQTMQKMLRTLEKTQKKKWKDHLNVITHAYNCSINSTTGYSPYYLMFGRHPLLPIDMILDTNSTRSPKTHKQYIKGVVESMKEAYRIAQECTSKQQKYSQSRKKKKELEPVEIGDRVLVRNVREKGGPGKLRSYWESSVYNVIHRKGGSEGVVYDVQKIGDTEVRTLHRNLLLPCNSLPLQENEIDDILEKRSHVKHKENRKKVKDADDGDDSDDNVDDGLTPNQLKVLEDEQVPQSQVKFTGHSSADSIDLTNTC